MCGESRVRTKSKTGKCPKTKQLRDHQRPTHISSQGQLSTTFVVVGALTLAALGCEKYEVMALLNCTNKQQSSTSDPQTAQLSGQEITKMEEEGYHGPEYAAARPAAEEEKKGKRASMTPSSAPPLAWPPPSAQPQPHAP